MTVVSMSEREIGRLKVLARIEDGRLNVAAAAVELGLTRRQMHRILKAWRSDGAAGLVSKRRGLSSKRTLPVAWRELVVDTVRTHYHDFGPTFCKRKAIMSLIGNAEVTPSCKVKVSRRLHSP